MRTVWTIAARRRAKWIIIPVFILLALLLGQFQPKLQERSDNANQTTWLPGESESREVIDDLERTIGGEEEQLAILTFGTEDGEPLSAEQRDAIRERLDALSTTLREDETFEIVGEILSPFDQGAEARGQVARDGSLLTAILPINGSAEPELTPVVDGLRDELDALPSDIESHVSGPAGLTVDAVKVFGAIDGTLLVGTLVLVLVLLLLIYRSPIIALIPLVSVALAYMATVGIVYLTDIDVNAQSTGILIVLMFGAGTDYCLLLVARFREELRRIEDAHAAMRETLTHTSPAIVSSGATVICAMLVLLLADSDPTRNMGPVLAIGIAMTVISGLLLLPSLLLLLGRRAFWPVIPRVGDVPRERFAFWRTVGNFVHRRPVASLVVPVVLLCVLALGNRADAPFLGFGSTDGFRTATDSAEGFEQMQDAFPAGELAPNTVLIQGEDSADVSAAEQELLRAFEGDEDVARISPDRVGEDDTVRTLVLSTAKDPFGEAAADTIPGIRKQLREVGETHGVDVTIGGPTAQTHDSIVAAERDDRLIIPLVLAVIFVILVVLLRAVVAPIHLVASVVLSFLATMGLSTWMFVEVLDQPGTTAGFATLVFLFVVALGVDYNIFLISRIREESAHRGTRQGTIEGVAVTGGIITSAGIILAGTFMVLASLPVLFLYQMGIAVAAGVLLDTFVVRGFIVPAMMMLLGERNWWPRHPSADYDVPPPGEAPSEPERVPAGVS